MAWKVWMASGHPWWGREAKVAVLSAPHIFTLTFVPRVSLSRVMTKQKFHLKAAGSQSQVRISLQ